MICFARMEFLKLQTYDLRINISVIVHLLYSGELKTHHIIQAIEISRIVNCLIVFNMHLSDNESYEHSKTYRMCSM